MSGTFAVFLSVAVMLVGAFWCFELEKPSAARLMPIVMLTAAGCLGRIIFAFIPQIQPTTAIVITAGAVLGASDGFMTGAMTALVSNIFFGQGIWTPFQMLAWGLVGMLAGIIARLPFGGTLAVQTVYSFAAAMLYSVVADMSTLAYFWNTLTVSYAVTIWTAGMLFNIPHAVGNIVFMLLLYSPIWRMLCRVRAKY